MARFRPLRRHATAITSTALVRCGSGATGSSRHSTATCRTTGSRSSNSPATCCRTPTKDQLIATGFNRNHMINFEGGAIPEEYQNEYIIDRLEATSTTCLGITLGCARCHNHKYDPLTQKDFYSFAAFFNSVPEKGLDGYTGNAVPFLQMPNPEQASMKDTILKADQGQGF